MNTEIEDKIYSELYNNLLNRYGKKSVLFDEKNMIINVTLSKVFYCINLSTNETKFYFCSIPNHMIQDLSYELYREVKSFRVFNLREAMKYIEFKELENNLITSIEG